MTTDRRRCKRYLVRGAAKFLRAPVEFAGELLNIGKEGSLIRSDAQLPPGANLTLRFTIEGYPEVLEAKGGVVHTRQGMLGFMFLQEPAEVERLMSWLEERGQGTVVRETDV